jgi:two-component system OmpR family sensor kinase
LDLIVLVKNLVDNAIRYTPNGGRIDIALTVQAGFATLQVKDTGPGIPAGERDRVFAPFYRALGSEQVGSGLGLSIVQTIAQRIGATVSLAYADAVNESGLNVSVAIFCE